MKRRNMAKTNEWERRKFLKLVQEGKSEVAAAQILGIPMHRVRYWKLRVEGFQEKIWAIKSEGQVQNETFHAKAQRR